MKTLELTMDQLQTLMGKENFAHMENLNESMSDIGRQIAHDQIEWVDKCMKDLLPPNLYDDAKKMRNLDAVASYMQKNEIKLIHMQDTLRLRIMVRGQIYGDWNAQLHMDGEKIDIRRSDASQN